jgi:hypothetical protein
MRINVSKENADKILKLFELGILYEESSPRATHEGASDYSHRLIQPWAIWQEYQLNPWDADILKRLLRTKQGDSRELDYKKIIHIAQERLRQLESQANAKVL